MTDATTLQLGETAEQVALELLRMVMESEKRKFSEVAGRSDYQLGDRKYILDTYAECILAVRRPFDRPFERKR